MLRSDGYSPLSIVLHWLAAIFVVASFLTHDGERNLSTTLRHRRFLFTDSFLLLWKWRVG